MFRESASGGEHGTSYMEHDFLEENGGCGGATE